VGEVARLQSTLARLGAVDVSCVVEAEHRFLVGPPSYTVVFRRPDGRQHRAYVTPGEVGRG
jgi:hypothetical protein